MSNYNGQKQRLIAFVLILIAGACLVACGSGSERWQEEVQLSDGRVIVVERELILEAGGDEWASNRSGSKPKEDRIRFTLPDRSGEIIEWRSKKMSPQTWPEIPLILDVESDHMVVFASVFNSRGCNIYSKYHYNNRAWVEERLPQKFKQRATNLFIFRSKDKQRFVDLEAKQKNISDARSRLFRQVGPTNPDCSRL